MVRWSVTTTDPIWRRSISEVASFSVVSAEQVTGGEDISSATAVGMGGAPRSGDGPAVPAVDLSLPPSMTGTASVVNVDQVNIRA